MAEEKTEKEMMNELSILAAALELERYGVAFYTKMSGCVRDKNGSSILKGLADDEEQHRRWIESEIDRLSPGTDPSKISPDPRMSDLIPIYVFPVLKGDACLPLKDEIKGVEVGISVENNSIKLYTVLAEGAGDPGTKELMARLIKVKKGHLNVLEDGLYHLKRGGSWYGYVPILDG